MARRTRDASLVRLESVDGRPQALLDLENADLTAFKMSFRARVRIQMGDGRGWEAEEEVPLGAAGRPAMEKRGAVEEKFRREVGQNVGRERAEAALARLC